MADNEPSILNQVRDLVWGPPKPKYRHTFLAWQPSDPAKQSFILMIASDGAPDGRTTPHDWALYSRSVGTRRLIVSAADMTKYEFMDVLTKAGDDVVKNGASGPAIDLAIQRLGAWSPPQREAGHTALAVKIYAAELENEFEDSLFHPDDIGIKFCLVM